MTFLLCVLNALLAALYAHAYRKRPSYWGAGICAINTIAALMLLTQI